MRTGHIAILTHQSNGHVYSALGLCAELVRRGYRVTYLAHPVYADRIEQAGVEVVLLPQGSWREPEHQLLFDLPHANIDWWEENAIWMFSHVCDYSAQLLTSSESFYEVNPPDLVLYDRWLFAGRILARRYNIPAVRICGDLALYRNYIHRDNGVFRNPKAMAEASRKVDSFLASHGVVDDKNIWHAEELNVHFIPRDFQFRAAAFDDRTCFVGSCLDRPIRPQWENRSNGRPIILISSTSGDCNVRYFQEFAEALAGSEFHVILSPSVDAVADYLSARLPENFEINRNASHLEILPHVTLAITQGGMGNTLEPIYHGVPVVVVPMTIPTQHQIAYRVNELGLGVSLPCSSLNITRIRQSIGRVLNRAEYLGVVRHMQKSFNGHGGAKEAADQIEKFHRSRRVSRAL